MKKLAILMTLLLNAMGFVACASEPQLENGQAPDTGEYFNGKKVLVAYFSWGGTTRRMVPRQYRKPQAGPFSRLFLSILILRNTRHAQRWHLRNATAMPYSNQGPGERLGQLRCDIHRMSRVVAHSTNDYKHFLREPTALKARQSCHSAHTRQLIAARPCRK